MKEKHFKWSTGNTKVSKLDAVAFGIPAYRSEAGFVTCPQAGACAAICYARQGSYTWRVVRKARETNLMLVREALLDGMLAPRLIADLERIKASFIRIHDSGDFFSQDYLDAWIAAARALPGKTFYAYTKSLHLNFSNLPANFKLTQSIGGKLDKLVDKRKSHTRIFSTTAARKAAGYMNGDTSDLPVIDGEIKIGLVYHGTRKLTKAQEQHFN